MLKPQPAPLPERGVLDDLKRAAEAKWRGDRAAQQWGLFARAAAEIERAWAARDAAVLDLEAYAAAEVQRAVSAEREQYALLVRLVREVQEANASAPVRLMTARQECAWIALDQELDRA
jgi:hypothetical protein